MDSFSIKDRVTILKKYFFFSIILISISPFKIYTQTSVLNFKHFSVDQGMSSSSVGAIYQDRTGYMWFGTSNGVDRYDGYNFTSYKYPGDSINFRNNFPGTISEDNEGNIWIGSYSGGLEKLNPETKTFTHYLPDPLQPETEWCNIVFAVYADKNDVMWVGTGNGFYKFNKSSGTFTSFRHDENDAHSLGHNTVNAIYEDRAGTLWLATGGGLDRFDRETNKFFHYWHFPNNKWGERKTALYWLNAITEDNKGVLWLGTSGGLVEFNRKTETFVSYIHDPQNPLSHLVQSICDDGSGQLWLASLSGLDVFNKKTKTFLNYVHDEKDLGSLSSNEITSVFLDRSGSLWTSTGGNGVNKLDCLNPLFKKYIYNPWKKGTLSSDKVYSLFENTRGTIWVCTAKGLEEFNAKTETFINSPYYIDSYNAIFQDHSGSLLICRGPASGGLYKFDQNKRWTCYIDSFKVTYTKPLTSLYPDRNNQFWIGIAGGDLYLFNSLTNKKKWITNIKKNPTTIYKDSYELVWFGGYATGLFCYDPNRDTIIQFNPIPKNPSTLIDNTILSFCEDHTNTLWFGSSRGLNKYNRSNNTFTRVSEKDGFLSEGVRQILEDDHGNLWMSTGKGITKFNPLTGKFKNYYTSSEFAGIKFYQQSGCRTENGEMYFGGENGFIRFHPDSIKDNPFIPPIVITSFRKFEKPFPFGKEVELPYTENFISFEFAALSYVNSGQNQYAYMMEGLDKDWIYSGTRRYASYPNMVPGEYVFKVKGSTSNLVWNEAGTSIKIIILPPWWRTTWAYIFYVLFIASIIYLTWKAQLKRLRIKHEFEMSKFEAQKLHEVDEIKSRFFTNISHEFRTPLTLILGPVKQIIERTKETKTKEDLNLVHKNANKLLGLVNQLLDISKLESGNMKLQTSPIYIIPYLKALVLSFTSYAERKRITLKFNSTDDEIIVYLDKDKVEKIITNILSNAFKFTPEGGMIEVNVNTDDKYANVSVSDTGIGIPKEKMEKIFDRFYQVDGSHTREQEDTGIGLSLTQELVDLHKGKIVVESVEGKGTTFTISIPLGNEHLKPEEIFKKDNEQEQDYEKEKIKPEYDDCIERKVAQKIDIDMFEKDTLPLLLIVEDNTDVRNYVKDNLKKDFRVLEAIDGEDGWNKSVDNHPDLIVSDVMMPKMDGFKLCEKLKTDERTSHIPIILLTAKAAKQDKIEGYELGADEYLMKPFEPAELRARIKNLIEQRKRIHQHFQKNGIFQLDQTKITSVDKKFLQKAFEIITQNISDSSFSIETFAEKLYVSKSLLRKKVVSLTGEPPVELIKMIRLKKAAELIEKNFGNLSEIALEVGFNNPAYFSECFKKQFGISPSQYHPKNTNN